MNQNETAQWLAVDKRTIGNWQSRAENPLPFTKAEKKGKSNSYSEQEVARWLVSEIDRVRLHKAESISSGSLEEERTRLTKEQADKAEFDNRVRAGELLERSVYDQLVRDVMLVQKSQLKQLRTVIQQEAPELKPRTLDAIEKTCAVCHNAILNLELPDDRSSNASD